MPVIETGLLTSVVPGVWSRLSLISKDGSIAGLVDERVVGQLEEFGIPRHQLGLAELLQSWQRARIVPEAAFALWLLRQKEEEYGCLYRRADICAEESSPAIRYIQLAAEVGETRQTDPTLDRLVAWLLDRQLPDGSIPLIVSTRHGETGQTARTLKALAMLNDPALDDRLAAMRDYLLDTAITQPTGVAWASSGKRVVVSGSTSLAVTALLRSGCSSAAVRDGIRFLLATEEPGGGWSEVPGYRPTIHNTFNVVRAIGTAVQAGVLRAEAAAPVLDRTARWFARGLRRQPPRSVLDHAFAVRLAVQLDLLSDPRVGRMARQLARRGQQFLDPAADTYAETEIAAIALVESSRRIDASPNHDQTWLWRWRLPSMPPPFLARGGYFYELLYGAIKSRRWVRVVDVLVHASIVDRSAGLLFGSLTAVGLVDPDVAAAIAAAEGAPAMVTLVIVGVLLLSWLAIKTAARLSLLRALAAFGWSLPPALALTWIFETSTSTMAALLSLIGLRLLVIDVVAFTADSTGLLDRLLPKKIGQGDR